MNFLEFDNACFMFFNEIFHNFCLHSIPGFELDIVKLSAKNVKFFSE